MEKNGADRALTVNAMDQKWQTEEDLRCFQRCAEVKRDPKRLKRVQVLAVERMKELAYVKNTVGGKEKK